MTDFSFPDEPIYSYYLSVLIALWPVWRICARAGLSRGRSVAAMAALFVPFIGVIVSAGLIALTPWPNARPPIVKKPKPEAAP